MKKILLAVTIALLTIPVYLSAQGMGLTLLGSFNIPTGDLSDGAQMGFGGAAEVIFKASPYFGIGGIVGYQYFFDKDQGTVYGYSASSGYADFPIKIHAMFFLPAQPPLSPYIMGGLGLHNQTFRATVGGVSASDNETDFGVYFGGGLGIGKVDLRFTFDQIFWNDGSGNYLSIMVGYKALP